MFGGDKDYILPDDMCSIMNTAFGMAEEESLKLFNQADTDNTGTVTYGRKLLLIIILQKGTRLFCSSSLGVVQ